MMCLTPIKGEHGDVGWVFCTAGTNPRGAIVALETVNAENNPAAIFYVGIGPPERLNDEQVEMVRDLIRDLENCKDEWDNTKLLMTPSDN
jgi:hypothetical protein